MARSLNKATIIGNLGKDPEVRFTPNGKAVCNFSVATDESYNDKNTGQKVDKVEFHRITAYGKLAEIMGQYLKKGSKIYIEGKLQTREWEKDGVKRYTTEIVASEMIMLDSRQDGQQQAQQQQGGYQAPQQPMQQQQGYVPPQHVHGQNPNGTQSSNMAPRQPSNAFNDFDDDIPFD